MKVQDIIDDLQAAEFSELAIGDSAFTETNTPRYLKLIQSALTELYSKFLLRQEELVIQIYEGQVNYPLGKEYAVTSGTADRKHIIDSIYQPYDWDLLQVLGVYDEYGQELNINDPNHICGVFISAYDSVMVPATITARQLSLICRANHQTLTGLTDEITLPITLRQALVWFIAARIWAARKDELAMNKSVQYTQMYLGAVNDVNNMALAVAGDTVEFNYQMAGWR